MGIDKQIKNKNLNNDVNNAEVARQTSGNAVFCDINASELRLCKHGDRLKLWSKPGYEMIHAYRSGYVGGLGRVLSMRKSDNYETSKMIDQFVDLWLEVEKLGENTCLLTVRSKNEHEESNKRKLQSDNYRKKISVAYKPKSEISIFLHVPIEHQVNIGQILKMRCDAIENFLYEMNDIELEDAEGNIVATTIGSRAKEIKLLKAKFNGYEPLIKIISVSKDKITTLGNGLPAPNSIFWSVYNASAVVSFKATLQIDKNITVNNLNE